MSDTADQKQFDPDRKPKVRRFSSTLRTEEIEIDGRMFKVKELYVEEKNAWKTEGARRVRPDTVGTANPVISNWKGMEADLICRCVRDDFDVLVTKELVAKWGTRLAGEIYLICLEVNGLTENSEKAEKNY